MQYFIIDVSLSAATAPSVSSVANHIREFVFNPLTDKVILPDLSLSNSFPTTFFLIPSTTAFFLPALNHTTTLMNLHDRIIIITDASAQCSDEDFAQVSDAVKRLKALEVKLNVFGVDWNGKLVEDDDNDDDDDDDNNDDDDDDGSSMSSTDSAISVSTIKNENFKMLVRIGGQCDPFNIFSIIQKLPQKNTSPQKKSAPPKANATYIMYLHTEDTSSSLEFLAACKAAAPKKFHRHCFQLDGTRHFTLMSFTGLTPAQAASITFTHQPCIQSLPFDIELTGLLPWQSTLGLSCNTIAKEKISQIMDKVDLSKLPPAKQAKFKNNNLHLSLYRARGFDKTQNSAGCKAVKAAMANRFGGLVRGVSVRLKVLGASYSDYRGERALMTMSILAMNPAKWLKTAKSTTD